MQRVLLCLVLVSSLGCTSARPCRPQTALSGFDCAGIERCDELLAVVGSFLEAHSKCVFPEEVSQRITHGCGSGSRYRGKDPLQDWGRCLGPVEVVSWDRSLPFLIDFVIRPTKPKGAVYSLVACLDAEGGWLLYWPMPADSEIKDVF